MKMLVAIAAVVTLGLFARRDHASPPAPVAPTPRIAAVGELVHHVERTRPVLVPIQPTEEPADADDEEPPPADEVVPVVDAAPVVADSYTGSIEGTIRDRSTGDAVEGATLIVTTSDGTQSAITDETGHFRISALRPGAYDVYVYYADITIERKGVTVNPGGFARIEETLDTEAQYRYQPITISYVEDVEDEPGEQE